MGFPHENQSVDGHRDALSDARDVLNRIDDVRLVTLIERWSLLSERVKDEIWGLAEYDHDDQIGIASPGIEVGELITALPPPDGCLKADVGGASVDGETVDHRC